MNGTILIRISTTKLMNRNFILTNAAVRIGDYTK